MIRPIDKLSLAGTLLLLFAAGIGTGYFLGQGRNRNAEIPTPAAAVQASSTDWWQRALDRLSDDLKLTDAQKDSVRPLLQHSAQQMFLNRDRAMFQIHLELLAFHDSLGRTATLLDASQKSRLDTLRARLRQRIESQFPQFLKDTPLPAVTASNGL